MDAREHLIHILTIELGLAKPREDIEAAAREVAPLWQSIQAQLDTIGNHVLSLLTKVNGINPQNTDERILGRVQKIIIQCVQGNSRFQGDLATLSKRLETLLGTSLATSVTTKKDVHNANIFLWQLGLYFKNSSNLRGVDTIDYFSKIIPRYVKDIFKISYPKESPPSS